MSVCAPQKPFFGWGVRWWGKNGQFQKFIIFSIFAYNSAKKRAILDHNTILETSGHILVSFEPKNGKKLPKISTPRRRSQKPKIWPTARWHVHLFYTRLKFGFQPQNPLRISICQFLSAFCIGFQPLRWSKIKKKNWKKWKNPVNWQFFHQFCPPTAYFQWMIDDSEVLHPFTAFWIPKNWFLGQKWEILNIWKFSNLPHFWGSGALIMLPQGQEDVCVQRGTPDDDFEYWTATVPRLGAEIWAAKVFWSKTKNSGKCISIIWIILMCLYHQNGTQWHQLISYGKQWSLWSFWGHLTGKQLVLSLKLLKNTTEKGQNQANLEQALFQGKFIIQIAQ